MIICLLPILSFGNKFWSPHFLNIYIVKAVSILLLIFPLLYFLLSIQMSFHLLCGFLNYFVFFEESIFNFFYYFSHSVLGKHILNFHLTQKKSDQYSLGKKVFNIKIVRRIICDKKCLE